MSCESFEIDWWRGQSPRNYIVSLYHLTIKISTSPSLSEEKISSIFYIKLISENPNCISEISIQFQKMTISFQKINIKRGRLFNIPRGKSCDMRSTVPLQLYYICLFSKIQLEILKFNWYFLKYNRMRFFKYNSNFLIFNWEFWNTNGVFWNILGKGVLTYIFEYYYLFIFICF